MSPDRPKPRRLLRRRADIEFRAGVWLAVTFAALALVVAVIGNIVGLRGLAKADDVERAACERVQVLRGQSNREARVIYLTLNGAQRSADARQSRFADLYAELAATVTFTPPTDCDGAVKSPGSYRPPAPIQFADCEVPPAPPFAGCKRK